MRKLAGDDELTKHYASTVIRDNLSPDGTELSPMRISESRLTLAVVAGDLEQAVDLGLSGLNGARRSLPSMVMAAGESDAELHERYPHEGLTDDFREAIRSL